MFKRYIMETTDDGKVELRQIEETSVTSERDPNKYQIDSGMTVASASREQLEQELMRYMDAMEVLENRAESMRKFMNDFTFNRHGFEDAVRADRGE